VWPRRAAILTLLALLYTGLNALLPLQIDDAAYVCYARQAARHPLDPYGFAVQWDDVPVPANDLLAPPVLPYSVAPAVWLFGERPACWKLALLPWALLLTFALHAHMRRFAAGLELRLTAFVLFSPALLPSLNLMLDVPALALSLSAVYLFLRACAPGSGKLAIVAGLLAALAMQTKYTGVMAPGAMAAATLVYRRPRPGLAAAAVAALAFCAWEAFIAIRYGRSHFLNSWDDNATTLWEKASLVPVFFSQLGGVAPALVLLGMATVGTARPRILAAGGATLVGYAAVALVNARFSDVARLFGAARTTPWSFQFAEVFFDVVAAAGVIVLVRVVRRLMAEPDASDRAATLFLLTWLAVEALGYLVLTPFPAARRVLGIFVVLSILFGRLAARSCATPERRWLVNGVIGFGITLGLAYFAIDWIGARAYQRGAEDAAAFVRARDAEYTAAFVRADGGGRTWYVGRWGFRYYAERCGMLPLVPRYEATPAYVELPPTSHLHEGDWLVAAEDDFEKSRFDLAAVPREEKASLVIEDVLPLRVVPCFYGGRTPLEHFEGRRLTVYIYRVMMDCEVGLVADGDSVR
jgi:4-amino-4-deoxy-L-arabinose transferase-like glycosyltransferase